MSDGTTANDLELMITRIVDAPRERLFQAWTDPKLLAQWFAPAPLTTTVIELDARPGGVFKAVMRDPGGAEYPCSGVFLKLVENERLVSTDAYDAGWQPSPKPFMTTVVTFEDAGPGRTKYTARARHWTQADLEMHEKMGFPEGWGRCLDPLVAVVTRR